MHQGNIFWPVARGALLVVACGWSAAALAAETDLSPGVEQRQLEQVDPDRFKVSPPVAIGVPEAPPMRQVADTPMTVAKFTFSGNTAFTDDELAALLGNYTGATTFRQLVEATQVVTDHYRKAGFLVARAYIPEQEIKDGAVDIAVVEGVLGEIRFTGATPITRERAAQRMDRLVQSGRVSEAELERGALLLNDLPGMSASVSLVPGKAPGQSDVELNLVDEGTWDFALDYNNFGSTVTGEHRLGAIIGANNLFNAGDRFTFRPIISDSGDTLYGSLGFDMPAFTPATTLGVLLSNLQSTLGEEFDGLDVENTAMSFELHGTHAFVRSRNRNIYGQAGYESRNFQRECGFCAGQPIPVIEDADYTLDVLQFGANGDSRDDKHGGGIWIWNAGLRLGLGAVSAEESGTTVAGRDRIDGRFTTLRFGGQRLQRVSDLDTLSFKADAQFSGENLDASERISLGGPDAVRAYRPSEALGDSGLVLQSEWRHQFPGVVEWASWLTGVEGYLLLDLGTSTLNDNGDNISRELDHTRTGWGAGVRLSRSNKFHFDLVIAARLGSEESLVDQPEDNTTNMWAQAIYWF